MSLFVCKKYQHPNDASLYDLHLPLLSTWRYINMWWCEMYITQHSITLASGEAKNIYVCICIPYGSRIPLLPSPRNISVRRYNNVTHIITTRLAYLYASYLQCDTWPWFSILKTYMINTAVLGYFTSYIKLLFRSSKRAALKNIYLLVRLSGLTIL